MGRGMLTNMARELSSNQTVSPPKTKQWCIIIGPKGKVYYLLNPKGRSSRFSALTRVILC